MASQIKTVNIELVGETRKKWNDLYARMDACLEDDFSEGEFVAIVIDAGLMTIENTIRELEDERTYS
jgi:hypothetical protein